MPILSKKEIEKEKQHTVALQERIRQLQIELESIQQELNEERLCRLKLDAELAHHKENLSTLLQSNLTAMPWLAGIMADFATYDLELEAQKLEWGRNLQREKKVAAIREIRADAKKRIEEAKQAVYQLEYLRTLFPGIDDLIETDYKDLHFNGSIPEHDPAMDYLTHDEWRRMSNSERDQLALNRYILSQKSNWQIGRDYELSVAYEYTRKGYRVDTFGSYKGLDDLGRDLIATCCNRTLIIQCKYWSKNKSIHERHIYQLYGTSIGYSLENGIEPTSIHPILITNTELSSTAKKVAGHLGVSYVEHHAMSEFPRIKCNIGKDEFGYTTKIYHLPMDAQYDVTKIEKSGEFYAFTVEEAVNAGFRRAYRWHNSSMSNDN